ncbi:hypothetical protein, partial [Streptomyces fradiae]
MTHPAPRKPDADEPHRVDGPHQVDGDSVDVDQALAARCTSHGDYLAGLIATAMLDTAARPDRLPETLFPDADPTLVRAIWNTALPVGYHAG